MNTIHINFSSSLNCFQGYLRLSVPDIILDWSNNKRLISTLTSEIVKKIWIIQPHQLSFCILPGLYQSFQSTKYQAHLLFSLKKKAKSWSHPLNFNIFEQQCLFPEGFARKKSYYFFLRQHLFSNLILLKETLAKWVL